MKIRKILLAIATIMLLIHSITAIACIKIIVTPKIEEKKVIEKFNNNRTSLEKSLAELKKYKNTIYLQKSFNFFLSGYEYDDEINKKVSSFEYQITNRKYTNTFSVMKKVDFKNVFKDEYGNVIFTFNTSFRIGQSIVYVENIEGYKLTGYEIEKIKKLDKKWYYIEAK